MSRQQFSDDGGGTTRSGVRDAGDDTIPVAVATAVAAAAAAGRLSQHAGVDPAAQHQPPPRQALHTLANHPSAYVVHQQGV